MTDHNQILIAGKPLHCLVCGYDQFEARQAQLNTAMASLFNMDWVNPSADCYVCQQCGYIHWFFGR